MPTEATKQRLIALDNLLISDIDDFLVEARNPIVSGCVPERITVEVRQNGAFQYLTYWYYWSYDLYRTDHIDWEPITLVYTNTKLVRAEIRVHNELVACNPIIENGRITVFFPEVGHTPIIRVKDGQKDVGIPSGKKQDFTRRAWYEINYRKAESVGWAAVSLPFLERNAGPKLDTVNWQNWGKDSMFIGL
jgi:hypothetical protein